MVSEMLAQESSAVMMMNADDGQLLLKERCDDISSLLACRNRTQHFTCAQEGLSLDPSCERFSKFPGESGIFP